MNKSSVIELGDHTHMIVASNGDISIEDRSTGAVIYMPASPPAAPVPTKTVGPAQLRRLAEREQRRHC